MNKYNDIQKNANVAYKIEPFFVSNMNSISEREHEQLLQLSKELKEMVNKDYR